MNKEKIERIIKSIKKENITLEEKKYLCSYLSENKENFKILLQDSFAVKSFYCPTCGKKIK